MTATNLPDPNIPSPFPTDAELTLSQRKVEARGGRLVAGPHLAKTIRYQDDSAKQIEAEPGNSPGKVTPVQLTGCGHTALAEIPNRDPDEAPQAPEMAPVCLICDGLFLSPKYSGKEREGP